MVTGYKRLDLRETLDCTKPQHAEPYNWAQCNICNTDSTVSNVHLVGDAAMLLRIPRHIRHNERRCFSEFSRRRCFSEIGEPSLEGHNLIVRPALSPSNECVTATNRRDACTVYIVPCPEPGGTDLDSRVGMEDRPLIAFYLRLPYVMVFFIVRN